MKYTFTPYLLLFVLSVITQTVSAQKIQDGKLWLNEEGSNYFKITLISQVWVRNTHMNPGTTIILVSGVPGYRLTDKLPTGCFCTAK
jgi:hypothetical protein